MAPVSVIDIGSNSVRLVVYEGLTRAPTVLFNEKVMCGLGKGLATTGSMDEEGVSRALASLVRFRALSNQAKAGSLHVLATAAAREAKNGPEFVRQAEQILGVKIQLLSGEEEARYSAFGILSGFHAPDGIAGDLGGGSLELIDIRGRTFSTGVTLPLGGIRLYEQSDASLPKARNFTRKQIRSHKFLEEGQGRTFYAVGGTWRNIAKLHMEMTGYPLHMMQGYELPFDTIRYFLEDIIGNRNSKDPSWAAISRSRRQLLPFGAIAMAEVLDVMRPAKVAFSAQGVREGYLYTRLTDAEQESDPLIAAADELAILRARSPEHARELADWTGRMMPFFDIVETAEEDRYRHAACLLADISWRAHPDYRGLQALNIIAHSSFIGITHPGRAFIALANYYRYEGMADDSATGSLAAIASPRLVERAKILGGLLRVIYLFSASMPGIIDCLTFRRVDTPDLDLEFVVPASCRAFEGERLDGRLQQLAKLTGKRLGFRYE